MNNLSQLDRPLTQSERGVKEEKRIEYLLAARVRFNSMLDNDDFSNLAEGEYGQLILTATRRGEISDKFESIIHAHILEGKLQVIGAYHILLNASGEYESWVRLKIAVFNWLISRISQSVSILSQATREGRIRSRTEFKIVQMGSVFSGTGELCIDGIETVSEPCIGESKRSTRYVIGVSLIKTILEKQGLTIEWSPKDINYSGRGSNHALEKQKNEDSPKSKLNYYCQIKKLPPPHYEAKVVGPKNMPIHKVNVWIQCGEKRIVSNSCEAPHKRKAEQLAAANLLVTLGEMPADEQKEQAAEELTFVELLHEFLKRNGRDLPAYSFRKTGSSHDRVVICTCNLKWGNGEIIRREGRGEDNLIAQQYVAREVWKVVSVKN